MAVYNATGTMTFPVAASTVVAENARVTLAADGTISTAGVGQDIGTASREASGTSEPEHISVNLLSKPGTHLAIASGAISAGSKVYGAAAGAVSATQAAGSYVRGIAMTDAVDGGNVELMPLFGDTAGV